MLLNRLVERLRRARLGIRLLRHRARLVTVRRPVILVPSVLGATLVGAGGRVVWGSLPRLFGGPSLLGETVQPARVLEGFTVVPGLWTYDVHGALARFL